MCGITGYINFDKENKASYLCIKNMTDIIIHRGPDGEGYYVQGNVALGHRRLSIIDLVTGDQPMFTSDKTKVIVFNGEIFNFRELKTELQKTGYKFQTNSDTEVILYSYDHWGTDCLNHFNGMWAFALYDIKKDLIFFARDRYGIKPFYYFIDKTAFYFASELKVFNSIKNFDIDSNEFWDEIVYGPKAGGKTFKKGIFELEPANYLILHLDSGKIEKKEYYSLEETFNKNYTKPDYAHIENLLNDSIIRRLIADVPHGTLNSGGLDSSYISTIVQKNISGTLHTFSVAPRKQNNISLHGDESEFAELLADHIKSNHTTIRYSIDDLLNRFESASKYNDGLLFHSNAIAMNIMFEEIRKNTDIIVLLSGEGADEVFRGYSNNLFLYLYKKYGKFPLLNNLLKKKILSKFSRVESEFIDAQPFPVKLALLHNCQRINGKSICLLLGIKGEMSEDRLALLERMKILDDYSKVLFYEQKCYLNGLLKRVDRMSMNWGLEIRVPFLDYRLIGMLNSIDFYSKYGWKNKNTKKILKKISCKILPEQIINRPKYGFSTPIEKYKNYFVEKIIKENSIKKEKLKYYNFQELFVLSNVLSIK